MFNSFYDANDNFSEMKLQKTYNAQIKKYILKTKKTLQ